MGGRARCTNDRVVTSAVGGCPRAARDGFSEFRRERGPVRVHRCRRIILRTGIRGRLRVLPPRLARSTQLETRSQMRYQRWSVIDS
eukprot:scaffold278026_cov48-Prasinocladus_malaysianus.AAC.1